MFFSSTSNKHFINKHLFSTKIARKNAALQTASRLIALYPLFGSQLSPPKEKRVSKKLTLIMLLSFTAEMIDKLLGGTSVYTTAEHFPFVRLGYYLLLVHRDLGMTRGKCKHHFVEFSS